MPKDKRSFFERLTGAVSVNESDDSPSVAVSRGGKVKKTEKESWIEEESDEGQLTVDVYQTANDIVIKTMIAGVKPEDLDISITRDMVTIKGSREETREVD